MFDHIFSKNMFYLGTESNVNCSIFDNNNSINKLKKDKKTINHRTVEWNNNKRSD
jgi:hypothetical protein